MSQISKFFHRAEYKVRVLNRQLGDKRDQDYSIDVCLCSIVLSIVHTGYWILDSQQSTAENDSTDIELRRRREQEGKRNHNVQLLNNNRVSHVHLGYLAERYIIGYVHPQL